MDKSLENKIVQLENKVTALEQRMLEQPNNPVGLLDKNDSNYDTAREIVEILTEKKLLLNEVYYILDQVKAILGYTRI